MSPRAPRWTIERLFAGGASAAFLCRNGAPVRKVEPDETTLPDGWRVERVRVLGETFCFLYRGDELVEELTADETPADLHWRAPT